MSKDEKELTAVVKQLYDALYYTLKAYKTLFRYTGLPEAVKTEVMEEAEEALKSAEGALG